MAGQLQGFEGFTAFQQRSLKRGGQGPAIRKAQRRIKKRLSKRSKRPAKNGLRKDIAMTTRG